jgi:hypothetical protein
LPYAGRYGAPAPQPFLVLPNLTLLYGTIAAIETYNGRDYRYLHCAL